MLTRFAGLLIRIRNYRGDTWGKHVSGESGEEKKRGGPAVKVFDFIIIIS
jgi:hypothetical protein